MSIRGINGNGKKSKKENKSSHLKAKNFPRLEAEKMQQSERLKHQKIKDHCWCEDGRSNTVKKQEHRGLIEAPANSQQGNRGRSPTATMSQIWKKLKADSPSEPLCKSPGHQTPWLQSCEILGRKANQSHPDFWPKELIHNTFIKF